MDNGYDYTNISIARKFAWGDNLKHTSFTYERTEDVDISG